LGYGSYYLPVSTARLLKEQVARPKFAAEALLLRNRSQGRHVADYDSPISIKVRHTNAPKVIASPIGVGAPDTAYDAVKRVLQRGRSKARRDSVHGKLGCPSTRLPVKNPRSNRLNDVSVKPLPNERMKPVAAVDASSNLGIDLVQRSGDAALLVGRWTDDSNGAEAAGRKLREGASLSTRLKLGAPRKQLVVEEAFIERSPWHKPLATLVECERHVRDRHMTDWCTR